MVAVYRVNLKILDAADDLVFERCVGMMDEGFYGSMAKAKEAALALAKSDNLYVRIPSAGWHAQYTVEAVIHGGEEKVIFTGRLFETADYTAGAEKRVIAC